MTIREAPLKTQLLELENRITHLELIVKSHGKTLDSIDGTLGNLIKSIEYVAARRGA